MSEEIIVIALLIILNGFFALSEMALVSASKPLLKQYAKKGSRRAALALKLAEDPGNFLPTIQIGITLVGILAGAYGGATLSLRLAESLDQYSWFHHSLLAPYREEISFSIIILIITYCSVIIGELVPKQLALKKAETLALWVAPFMQALTWLTHPLVRILDISGNIFLRPFGLSSSTQDIITEEEVKAVLAEGKETGILEKSEHEMLQRIMRLSDRDVRSFMTPRVDIATLDKNEPLETIRYSVLCNTHSRYPVVEGDLDHIIGTVETREILSLPSTDSDPFAWHALIHPVHVIPEHASGLKALDVFKQSPISLAVIVDEYGATQGLITAADLLEAIIGILPSNYDSEEKHITRRSDSSWLIDGTTPLDEVYLVTALPNIPPSNEYQTLAGFILHNLSKTPDEGDVVEWSGYRFEIIDMDHRRIDKILMEKKDQDSAE